MEKTQEFISVDKALEICEDKSAKAVVVAADLTPE
jgi:hypothetical protein